MEHYLGGDKKVLAPINWGNTGLDKVQQNFSEPLMMNRVFDLLRQGLARSVSEPNLTVVPFFLEESFPG